MKGGTLGVAETNNHDYLKDVMTVEELTEEFNTYATDIRDAEFKATLDIVAGVREGYEATMQLFQDIIERLEEKSPDPEKDSLITSLYNAYDALEDMHRKCDYL